MRTEDIRNATEELSYMVSLRPTDSGLTKVIWLSTKMGGHGPRIKISASATKLNKDALYPITIESSPRFIGDIPAEINQADVDLAKEWIKKNKDALLAYWNEELSTPEFLSKLQKL